MFSNVLNPEEVVVVIFKEYLDPSIKVSTIIQTKTTYPLVKVNRMGGKRHNEVIDRALMVMQVYAKEPYEAMKIANQCREILYSVVGKEINGFRIAWYNEVGGPAYFPDPDNHNARYQFSGEIDLKTQLIQK